MPLGTRHIAKPLWTTTKPKKLAIASFCTPHCAIFETIARAFT